MHKLQDPNLSEKEISDVIYRGSWEELQILKSNPKFEGFREDVWPLLAKDAEFYFVPWYPLVFALLFLSINLLFNFVDGFWSLMIVFGALLHISYGIPFMNKVREANRIIFIDNLLEGSPYHKGLFEDVLVGEILPPEPKDEE